MKTNLKPANAKARALLIKLQALADRGIDGERIAAQNKIVRLKARFDFTGADPAEPPDLFMGNFQHGSKARKVYTFKRHEFDVANCVKWAIESAAKIPCVYRDGELLAEAAPGTVRRLTEIAAHIAHSFQALLDQFGAVAGVGANDRAVFVMGLYDGMMGETRQTGERLPGRAPAKKARKAKKDSPPPPPGLHVHPYTVGLSLGRQIRFSAPLEQITAELVEVTRKHIST